MMYYGARVHEAESAVKAAERRKLPVPDDVYEAQRLRAVVSDTVHLPDPERPALPDTADQAAAVIQAHAEALRLADVTRRAADLFADEAGQRYIRVTQAAVPQWVNGLDREFQILVNVVRKAAEKLPEDVTQLNPRRMNWSHPQHAAAYTKAEGAAVQLMQLVKDRAAIAKVVGSDGGRDNDLFAVAALPEADVERVMNKDWRRLAPVIGQWRDLHNQPVARWVHLVRQEELTLSLATPGQVRDRAAEVERWRDSTLIAHSGHSRAGARAAVAQRLAL
ncbi:hypothetical protein ACFUJU_10490 [Streptomyces sp. NPDC057235]|uniref:hypothetical protein n=1 Tax=Streptomyces sp. NPDC057235 TaxID=3346058 RepID=UPI0036418951